MAKMSELQHKNWASSFERNRYFYGKMLTVRDFEVEQKYGIEKNHLINRLILGEGIVRGLEVEDIELQKQREEYFLKIKLSQGVALDCYGHEIVVSKNISEKLEVEPGGTKYIYIEYKEEEKEPIPNFANGSSDEINYSNRVEETFDISISSEPPEEVEEETVLDVNNESLDELVQEYYDKYLREYSEHKNYRLLLAVVDISEEGKTKINTEETEKYRKIVYSNAMLYDLISKLSSDTPATVNSGVRIFTGTQELEFPKEKDEEAPEGSFVPVSVTIDELKKEEPFSVTLAPILPAEIPPIFHPPVGEEKAKSGVHFIFGSNPQLPRTYVAYVPLPYNKTFEIHGFDPNLVGKQEKVTVVYTVMAGAKQINGTSSLTDKIVAALRKNPDRTIASLNRELKDIERSQLEGEITKLVDEGVIVRSNGNKFRLSS